MGKTVEAYVDGIAIMTRNIESLIDNLRAGLIIIEAWFKGYWGSPGLGGSRTAGLYAYARLLDYEDTRLKHRPKTRYKEPRDLKDQQAD